MLLPEARSVFESESGAAALWPAVLSIWGPGGASDLHAHHAFHLMVAVDGVLSVRTGPEAEPQAGRALLTRPDVPHAIDARGARVVLVFVDPESEMGGRLDAVHRQPVTVFTDQQAMPLKALLEAARTAPAAGDAVTEVLLKLGVGDARPALRHRAIRKVLRHLREQPNADHSLQSLAVVAGLSPSRFMHLFTKEVGIPLRPYLRWQKLERAAALIAAGSPLSEAAHGAGFADAAHMTRSFRAMFGTTPSEIRRARK